MSLSSPLYSNLAQRDAAIRASFAAGMSTFDIAREQRISEVAVWVITGKRAPVARGASGMSVRDQMHEHDTASQRAWASAALRGSEALLAAQLRYHWRTGTLPPGFDSGRFFALVCSLGITLEHRGIATRAAA